MQMLFSSEKPAQWASGVNELWHQIHEFTKVLIMYTNEPQTGTIAMRTNNYEMCSFQMDLLAFVANARVVCHYNLGILLAASIIRNLHVASRK